MYIAFIGEKDQFLVIYLDEITVFSKYDKENHCHLRKFFLNWWRFGLSLNPKKSLFSMKEGKLLGHIVSVEGVRIDLSRVEAFKPYHFPYLERKLRIF